MNEVHVQERCASGEAYCDYLVIKSHVHNWCSTFKLQIKALMAQHLNMSISSRLQLFCPCLVYYLLLFPPILHIAVSVLCIKCERFATQHFVSITVDVHGLPEVDERQEIVSVIISQ